MSHTSGQRVPGVNLELVADRIVFVQSRKGSDPDISEIIFHKIPYLVARYVVGIGRVIAVTCEIAAYVFFVHAVHADGYPEVVSGVFIKAVNVFTHDHTGKRFVVIHPEESVCSADPVPAAGIFLETGRMLVPAFQLRDKIEFVLVRIPGEYGVGYSYPYRSFDRSDGIYV